MKGRLSLRFSKDHEGVASGKSSTAFQYFAPNFSCFGPLIIGNIFSFLEYRDVLVASTVCTVWHQSCEEMETINISNCNLNTENQLIRTASRHCNVKHIKIQFQASAGKSTNYSAFCKSINQATKLESLEMRKCVTLTHPEFISPSLKSLNLSLCKYLAQMKIQCSNLKELNVTDCTNLTDEGLENSLSGCTGLETLIVNGCGSLCHPCFFLPNLITLDMGDCEQLTIPKLECPKLKNLSLKLCPSVDDTSLEAILYTPFTPLGDMDLEPEDCLASSLESLDVSGGSVNNPSIRTPALKYLNLSDCQMLEHPAIIASKLLVVKLNDAQPLKDLFLNKFFANKEMNLEELYMRGCKELLSPEIKSDSLIILDMSDSPLLTNPVIECPKLNKLKVDKCPKLRDAAVTKAVQVASASLQILTLNRCDDLVNPNISSQTLELLEMSECNGLKKPVIVCPKIQLLDLSYAKNLGDQPLADIVAGCTNLTGLCLRGCSSLKNPVLESKSLMGLEMSMCKKLSRPKLLCPNLKRADILSCSALQQESIDELMDLCFQTTMAAAMSSGADVSGLSPHNILQLNMMGSCTGGGGPDSPGSARNSRILPRPNSPSTSSDGKRHTLLPPTTRSSSRGSGLGFRASLKARFSLRGETAARDSTSSLDPLAQAKLKYYNGDKKECVIS